MLRVTTNRTYANADGSVVSLARSAPPQGPMSLSTLTRGGAPGSSLGGTMSGVTIDMNGANGAGATATATGSGAVSAANNSDSDGDDNDDELVVMRSARGASTSTARSPWEASSAAQQRARSQSPAAGRGTVAQRARATRPVPPVAKALDD